jgi:nucleotidyltransferase substrate binding protein (TIGR01987 family)
MKSSSADYPPIGCPAGRLNRPLRDAGMFCLAGLQKQNKVEKNKGYKMPQNWHFVKTNACKSTKIWVFYPHMKGLILTSLERAAASLRAAVNARLPAEDALFKTLHRDAVIQRFEYTFEIAWKMMKRHIEAEAGRSQTEDLFSKKDLFRRAMEAGLISDPEAWFAYLLVRNETSYAYEETKAEQVFSKAVAFVDEVECLLARLQLTTKRHLDVKQPAHVVPG